MALEFLNSIRKTEEEADRIRKEAQTLARALVKEAETEGELLLVETEKQAAQEASILLTKTEEEAQKAVRQQRETFAQELTSLREKAQRRIPDCAAMIVSEMKKL